MDNKNIILTPDHIKDFMVKLARLSPDDVVLDTCTGTGGFLMEAMEVLCRMAGGDVDKLAHIKEKQLIGFENDVVLFSLACSNMFLHGDGRSTLLYRSSLLGTDKVDKDLLAYVRAMGPTKCIINPPYEGSLPIQFTRQGLDYLEPGGKLIIIMPETTLSKHAEQFGQILKKAKLDFVVRMPEKLFAEQNRTVNTAIFGFTNTPHDPSDEVLFYDLSDDGFESVQHRGRLDTRNLWEGIESAAVDAVRNQREVPGISQKRLIFKDGLLRPDGYLPTKTDATYEHVAIDDLFNIADGTLASGAADESGKYTFVTASSEWKTHTDFKHDTKAIVFAVGAGGSLGRTHFVEGKFVASNLCLVLTEKDPEKYPVDLEFYNHYFQTIREHIVSDLASGTSKKTIRKASLANYEIDYVPLEIQQELINEHVRNLNNLRAELTTAENSMAVRLRAVKDGSARRPQARGVSDVALRAILDAVCNQRTAPSNMDDFLKNAQGAINSAISEHVARVQEVTAGVIKDHLGSPVKVVLDALIEAGWPKDQSSTMAAAQTISDGNHLKIVGRELTW